MQCFQIAGEHRRCLVTLEHRGLLAAEAIDPLVDRLKPKSELPSLPFSATQMSILTAVHLAASCLFHLHEADDTLTLLEPFLSLEEIHSDQLVKIIKKLIPNEINSVNTMAGIYFIAGKCFDLLESRHRCLSSLTIALKIDPAVTEIAEYISMRGLLSERDKRHLLRNVIRLDDEPTRSWLKPYYRSVPLFNLIIFPLVICLKMLLPPLQLFHLLPLALQICFVRVQSLYLNKRNISTHFNVQRRHIVSPD